MKTMGILAAVVVLSVGVLLVQAERAQREWLALLSQVNDDVLEMRMDVNELKAALEGEQTIYVSSQGHDDNPGTITQPVLTLSRALRGLKGPTTIYVLPPYPYISTADEVTPPTLEFRNNVIKPGPPPSGAMTLFPRPGTP